MAGSLERGERLRVLHVTREFPPVVWGGLGTAVGGLAEASVRAGMDVVILLVHGSSGGGYRGESLPAAVAGNGGMVTGSVRIVETGEEDAQHIAREIFRSWRPSIIHVHPVELGSFARGLAESEGLPLVYTIHSMNIAEYTVGHEPSEILGLWHMQYELIRAADRIIAVSESEMDLVALHVPEAVDRVRVIGNGIADRPVGAKAVDDGGVATVLFVGRFVTRKGIGDLFDAIPAILARLPKTRFVLVGGYGPAEDVARNWLPHTLESARDRIEFTGWMTSDQVERRYQDATVLVVPSWYEPFGMVILEGMVRGIPIAAANVGGPAEILVHERTGLLFPARDPASLAACVLRLLLDPSLRMTLGQAARAEVLRRWLWSRLMGTVTALYRDAIAARRAA
jgi:glycogen(starch) synthase